MKNKDEILVELIDVGILVEISGMYILSEKYKELLTQVKQVKLNPVEQPKKLSSSIIDDIGNTSTGWDESIGNTSGRIRAENLMNACEIPMESESGYRLRSLPFNSIRIVDNIIEDPSIIPADFIAAIKTYYANTDFPKAFKNLLLEGDVIDIYNTWISAGFDPNSAKNGKSNSGHTWL